MALNRDRRLANRSNRGFERSARCVFVAIRFECLMAAQRCYSLVRCYGCPQCQALPVPINALCNEPAAEVAAEPYSNALALPGVLRCKLSVLRTTPLFALGVQQ